MPRSPVTAMEVNDIQFEDYTNRTEAEVTKEQQETELKALLTERLGYETRLNQALADPTTSTPEKIAELERSILDVNAVLEGLGVASEPRSKVRK